MKLLHWPFHPLVFSATWDLVEMYLFMLLCACFVLVMVLVFVKGKWMTKLWTMSVVVAVALLVPRWAETMCFSVVNDPPPLDAVPEVPASQAYKLWEHQRKGIPLVIRGVLNETDVPLHHWTPKHLKSWYGSSFIQLQWSNVEQADTELTSMEFARFLDLMENEEWVKERQALGKIPYYAEADALFEKRAELAVGARNLLRALNLTRAGRFHYQTLFWIGPAGTVTGLHYDIDALNVLYQMYGSKTLWIYPIDQSKYVYPSPKYDFGAKLALVDHFNPDLERYPDFAKAKPLKVTVNAGDTLFVPTHWYHAARSESASVSVSVRLFSLCESLSLAPLTVMHVLHHWGWYRHNDCVCHNAALSPY